MLFHFPLAALAFQGPDIPELSHDFGGGASSTTIHPVVLGGLIVVALLIFLLPRRFVIVPVLAGILLVPLGQQVYAAGVHWLVCRLIVLIGLVRVLLIKGKGERLVGGFTPIDKAFFWCG